MHTHTHIYYAWGKTVMMHPDDNKKKKTFSTFYRGVRGWEYCRHQSIMAQKHHLLRGVFICLDVSWQYVNVWM